MIKIGLSCIQLYAPRLKFVENEIEEKRPFCINIYYSETMKCPSAQNTINNEHGAKIFLPNEWPHKKRSSVHEILHCLGLMNEHNRKDGEKYLEVAEELMDEKRKGKNYTQQYDAITKIDLYSIMLYPQNLGFKYKNIEHYTIDQVSNMKINEEMSELDKLSLNQIYSPSSYCDYRPKLGKNGLFYCGRRVMKNHNRPSYDLTSEYCGPDDGPNCNACRVLISLKSVQAKRKGLWQGRSGIFYCGTKFKTSIPGHTGVCGPNNGEPCKKCLKFMNSPFVEDD
jgi:hypothetical protein